MIDNFFKIWAIVIPITSIVLIPSIKGTLPSYFFAIFSFIIGLVYYKKYEFKSCVKFIYVFVFLAILSQFCVSIYGLWLPQLVLVDKLDSSTVVFRTTMLTQSVYLIPCILVFIYTKSFYRESWDKWIFRGGTLLALYGVYEFVFFMLTGENGDFLSNRWFGTDDTVVSGSLFQQITLGGITIERLKSLVGEPSMYAYTMMAYWIYAIHTGRNFLSKFYFLTLLLSTSTSAFLGMCLYCLYRIYKYGKKFELLSIFFIIVISIIIFYDIFYDFIDKMILAKIYMENTSGIERGGNILDAINVFVDSPLFIQFFGWGWGVIRSTDFFSTLLINTGIVGFLLWSFFVLYPCVRGKKSYRIDGVKAILIVEYIVMMISVSEFSYMFYWMFLGIAYNSENNQNIIRS